MAQTNKPNILEFDPLTCKLIRGQVAFFFSHLSISLKAEWKLRFLFVTGPQIFCLIRNPVSMGNVRTINTFKITWFPIIVFIVLYVSINKAPLVEYVAIVIAHWNVRGLRANLYQLGKGLWIGLLRSDRRNWFFFNI